MVSFFVIIGIGVDDILVFINTFKQSARLAGLNTVHKRITHTIIEASKATFFTSVTTAVAFFANAISSVSTMVLGYSQKISYAQISLSINSLAANIQHFSSARILCILAENFPQFGRKGVLIIRHL